MEGVARSTFWRNRIGFCVLHPASLAGSPAEVQHVDGTIERTVFPTEFISDRQVQPFVELRRIAHEITPGRWAEVEFSGNVFETEDQRNWSDASFKTFCTPLRLPYPVEVRQGTKISQSISIHLRESEPGSFPVRGLGTSSQQPITQLSIDPSTARNPNSGDWPGHSQPRGSAHSERDR